MSSTSTPFDWDRAISLFKSTDQWYTDTQPLQSEESAAPEQPRCRKGLHDMTPDNVSVNARTGHRRCRACIRQAKQARRERVQTPSISEEAVEKRRILEEIRGRYWGPPAEEEDDSNIIGRGQSESPAPHRRPPRRSNEQHDVNVSLPVPQFTVSPKQLTITVTPPELTVTPPSLVMPDTALLAMIPTDSVVSYLRSLGYTVIGTQGLHGDRDTR